MLISWVELIGMHAEVAIRIHLWYEIKCRYDRTAVALYEIEWKVDAIKTMD